MMGTSEGAGGRGCVLPLRVCSPRHLLTPPYRAGAGPCSTCTAAASSPRLGTAVGGGACKQGWAARQKDVHASHGGLQPAAVESDAVGWRVQAGLGPCRCRVKKGSGRGCRGAMEHGTRKWCCIQRADRAPISPRGAGGAGGPPTRSFRLMRAPSLHFVVTLQRCAAQR